MILGTSGWQYRSWQPAFYGGEKQKLWLEHFATQFQTVEVNNAFYRLPERNTFESWARRTPEDFIVGVKASRYLTHIKRLKDPEEPVDRFVSRVVGLGKKLGPVLLQLPPNFEADLYRLEATLARFPPDVRVAVEFRHDSWWTQATRRLLEKYRAALTWADGPKRSTPTWRTTDWGYLRFHQGKGRPLPCYRPSQLKQWASTIAKEFQDEDFYAYFNNDPNACAVRDAGRFGDIVEESGLSCSRRPNHKEITVGSEAFDGQIG